MNESECVVVKAEKDDNVTAAAEAPNPNASVAGPRRPTLRVEHRSVT